MMGGTMPDTIGPRDPLGGEYTDSELPLSAELPKEEYEEVEELVEAGEADDDELDDDLEIDTAEYDVDVIEIVEPDTDLPPERRPPL
jgi:hypothetical protein